MRGFRTNVMVPVEPDYRRRRFDVAFEIHVGTFVDVGNVQVTAQSYFQPRGICVKTKSARVNNTAKRVQSSMDRTMDVQRYLMFLGVLRKVHVARHAANHGLVIVVGRY